MQSLSRRERRKPAECGAGKGIKISGIGQVPVKGTKKRNYVESFCGLPFGRTDWYVLTEQAECGKRPQGEPGRMASC